jgi:Ca2+-binding RTX toxin-like protein
MARHTSGHTHTLRGRTVQARDALLLLHDDKDLIFGGDGNDTLSGNEGEDVAKGGAGNDYLVGYNKFISGRGDNIDGTARAEETPDEGPRGILGGPGNDTVRSSGATSDTIYISDGERDTVGCGGGTDTVYFDNGVDRFIYNSSCEHRVPR